MRKIDITRPRYALPLICFPFLLLFFYVYKSGFAREPGKVNGADSLQMAVGGVSRQVQDEGLSGKLEAFRNKFKQADGYTAVGGIMEEKQERAEVHSAYNEREKRMLDSIDQVMKRKYAGSSGAFSPNHFKGGGIQGMSSRADQDKALALALAKIKQPGELKRESLPLREAPDPMQLFRAQMALIDSAGRANDPEFLAKREQEKKLELLALEEKNRKKVPVRKASIGAGFFNTIVSEENLRPISAVVDQDITGFSGSRLRIRLLDDVLVGKTLIKKGTYLYALISGFSAQRVSLSVTSVFNGGDILPVNLQVYDNDGLPGIYVPSSAFREFTRDLGSSGSQGITLQQQAETNNQLVMGILSKMFQSTTTAVSKLIRSNKAKIRGNTIVYLIDTDELKKKQQAY